MMQFATIITSPDRYDVYLLIMGKKHILCRSFLISHAFEYYFIRVQQSERDNGQFTKSSYRIVKPGDEVSFMYDEHDKMRHKV